MNEPEFGLALARELLVVVVDVLPGNHLLERFQAVAQHLDFVFQCQSRGIDEARGGDHAIGPNLGLRRKCACVAKTEIKLTRD